MLERHGSVTVGGSLWEAYMRLERLEHSALIALQANAVQPVTPLKDEQIKKLADMRKIVFAQRGRDVCAECNACMVSERHASRVKG
jgi:ribulose-5-phosphate 4-epimerase/fuculose-1-phosphate aldolase